MPLFYTVYRTTCLVDGSFYIGSHSTQDLNDGYLGSGVELTKAIRRHGQDAFEKKILHVFDNVKEMHEREMELITQASAQSPDLILNINPGNMSRAWGKKRVVSMYLQADLVDQIDDYCRKNNWNLASAGRQGGLLHGRTTGRATLVEFLFTAVLDGQLKIPPWTPSDGSDPGPNPYPSPNPKPNPFPGQK